MGRCDNVVNNALVGESSNLKPLSGARGRWSMRQQKRDEDQERHLKFLACFGRKSIGAAPAREEAEAAEQWPAEPTRKTDGAGAIARRDGELALYWLPSEQGHSFADAMELAGWYPIPAAGDVERWCLGSTAETPVGDHVEPDHPDAWPRLLGLI